MELKEALLKRKELKSFISKALPEKVPTGMIVEDIIVAPSNNIGNFLTQYHTGSVKAKLRNEHLLAQYPLTDYTVIIDYTHADLPGEGDSLHESLADYIRRNSK